MKESGPYVVNKSTKRPVAAEEDTRRIMVKGIISAGNPVRETNGLRSSVKNAVKGYKEINLRAMKLIKNGGFLATCSCSHFMSYELFTETINKAARDVHRYLRQVEFRTQAPDHPILWSSNESYYLKFYIFQVLDEM